MPLPSYLIAISPGRCRLTLLITPNARQDRLIGEQDGALKVQINAPPVEGAANKQLVQFLARKVLKLPRSSVQIAGGEQSRHKRVEIDAPAEKVAEALAACLYSPPTKADK